MAQVDMQVRLPVTANQVWDLIGKFNALPDWHPAVEKSELQQEGQVRLLKLIGGGTITERLEKIDDDEKIYSYTITDSPLPIADYVGTISVKTDDDGNAVVSWSSRFNSTSKKEQDAIKAVQDIYQAGFDSLQKIFK